MVALETATNTFLGWAALQGIESPLNLSHGVGFGRYTTCRVENIAADDDILRIPISSCIKSDSLESLAERLSYERNKETSKWAPYINVLPKLDDLKSSLPRFWDAKRLETITDGGQLEARMIKDDRKGIDPWALACVDSRANYLGESYAMTPMLDMISHDGSVSTRAKVKEEVGFESSAEQGGVLCLTSGRSYLQGEEVFISYGNLSNLDTLADYGFVTKDNPCNSETINIQMMLKPPLSITINADGTIAQVATLRWYFADKDELEMFSSLENGSGLGILSKPLSDRNELDVQSFIASTLDEAAYNANLGATEIGGDDETVRLYLSERSKLLYSGIEKIKAKYPDMEY